MRESQKVQSLAGISSKKTGNLALITKATMQSPRVLSHHVSNAEFLKQHQEEKEEGHLAISYTK
jgi:hypothetical protein